MLVQAGREARKRLGAVRPGLSEVCRRLELPVPPRGFWAKVQHGHRMRRPPLPELQSGEAEEILVYGGERPMVQANWLASSFNYRILVHVQPHIRHRPS
jgi:hypothetical protein